MTAGPTAPSETTAHGGGTALRVAVGLLGAGAVALGVVLLVDPEQALDTLALLLGVALVIGGLIEIAFGWERPHRLRALVVGTVLVVGGIVAAAWPGVTLTALAWIVGLSLVVHGVLRVAIAVAERHEIPEWGWLALAGAVNVVIGVLAMAWPEVTVRVLAVVLGLQAVLFGVLLVLAAFVGGRVPGRAPRAG